VFTILQTMCSELISLDKIPGMCQKINFLHSFRL